MRISLDGRESDLEAVSVGTVGEAYEASLDPVNRMGRTVLDLRLDGKVIATEQRVVFFEKSVDEFDEMVLETVNTLELVRAAVVEARKHLTPCREALQSAQALLADGHHVRALQTLKPTLDVWMGVCEAVTKAAILLGIDLAGPIVNDLSIEGAQMLIVAVLERTRAIFDGKDWRGLGDLSEHELLPLVASWESICRTLEAETISAAN